MKQLYITILVALISSAAFAQQDFRQGYIVQNGDTLTGFVDYRGAQRNTHQISFKSNDAAQAQSFLPNQVQGYGFQKEHKYYESKLVPAFDTLSTEQTLFAQLLVKGKANLYYLRDPLQKDRFYISKDSEPLRELKVEEFKQKNTQEGRKLGHTYMMRRELYKPVLMQTFLDCSSITEDDINKVVIGLNSLSAIVKQYNECIGQEEYSKVPKKIRIGLGPVAGISSSTLSYKIEDSDLNFNNTSVKPVAGIFFNFSMPTISEKLSLQLEMLYAPNYFEASVGDDPSVPGNSTSEIWIDVTHLKVPVLARYTYPRGTFRPYFNIGPVINLVASQKNEITTTSTFGGATRTKKEPFLGEDDFLTLSGGMTAGLGISYSFLGKPLNLEARYEMNDGVSRFSSHDTSIKSLMLVLSYKL
ncbi:PorT family protein [Pontibacter sp. BT310]|uniref:PorT family protein n=1 Tax=Pontibacter populi TaxID=890055 RepID=A0ABS6X729_9BACT|nr:MULTISPECIES: porin family protein [Pontibacter]MBJ6116955.1 PorT family protein [Pontibacter sp. BT310]MBR0569379.1 PorT family protein [Microvirga sp. STS03]MBW3363808.1 PorT family protein [Pontibacter populi]